jgi:hypothetical protein
MVLAIYRTQLFNAADIDTVKRIQAGYTVELLPYVVSTNLTWGPHAVQAFALTEQIRATEPAAGTNRRIQIRDFRTTSFARRTKSIEIPR